MSWITLRSLGNSKAVQLSALFPLVGYLILFNGDVSRFLNMGILDLRASEWSFWTTLWNAKLYFLYFGLMALGIGSAIYQTRCPNIIKKHADPLDYIRVDGDSLSDNGALDLARQLGREYSPSWSEERRNNATIDLMYGLYEREAYARSSARYAVTTLFTVGLFLLGIPSLLTAFRVAKLIMERTS